MKPLFFALPICVLSVLAVSCSKKNNSPGSNSSSSVITFMANGDSAVVTQISIDTSRASGFVYPQMIIYGLAAIPQTKDTLTFEAQVYNGNNTYVSVNQFMGIFNDTSYSQHSATLTLSSLVNGNAYQDDYTGANNFFVNITSNDGKTITATFYGSLVTIANNNGAPPRLPITNGTMKITLP